MAPGTDDSVNNFAAIEARTRHTLREPSPQPQESEATETTLGGVGGQFEPRRESYPTALDFGEPEDTLKRPASPPQAELLTATSNTGRHGPLLGNLATTPTRARLRGVPYLRIRDLPAVHRHVSRKSRRRDLHSSGYPASNTEDSSVGKQPHSTTTVEDLDDNDDHGRGRSTTPTPLPPRSDTPSHHSEETVEDENDGRGPVSPHPYSEYHRYDPKSSATFLNSFEGKFPGSV